MQLHYPQSCACVVFAAAVRRWLGPGLQLLHHPTNWPHAAAEVHISMWRQQQQLAALGSGPAWQQPGTAAAAVAAKAAQHVVVSLQGLQVSPYGITGQAVSSSSSSGKVGQQQQQHQGDAADADAEMPDATAAAGAAPDVALLPVGCPLLLVRQSAVGSAGAGWSLLLPAGWVMPFWMALTHTGEVLGVEANMPTK